MDFLNFCRAHGILIDHIPPIGTWRRYPTDDHPRKRNGAVKYMGDHAFVQNHALEIEISVWRSDKPTNVDRKAIALAAKKADDDRQRLQQEAAAKAAWIIGQSQYAKHGYLHKKGFPDDQGNVWIRDDSLILVVPMRVDGRLVGCQLIDESGDKKFLYGQRTSEAEYVIDNKGTHILCEGYATALSIRACLTKLKRRYTIHVCFSAHNMVKIASKLPSGCVVADNDASQTGERVAKQIGWPYWMSDVVGEDFNDAAQRMGDFKASMSLSRSLKII